MGGPLNNGFILQGRYKIINLVGRGGMGYVYRAWDMGQQCYVALKEMRQDNLSTDKLVDAQRRFAEEANMLKKLTACPHIPDIYDSFSEHERSFLIMQFIEGKTLRYIMEEQPNNQLPVEKVIEYGIQLCEVLSYLHQQVPPVIFRDLKPDNVMVTASGLVYLIDFGVARQFKPEKLVDTEAFGSLGYAAPEILWQVQTEPRSDLYSLGATLYHCLTGFHPMNNTPTPFSFQSAYNYNWQVPSRLDNLLLRLVATLAESRLQNAELVRHELLAIRSGVTETTVQLNSARLDGEVASLFYEPKTAQAVQLFISLALINKLPGLPGKLWDKMIPFFTAVGVWFLNSCIPFFQRICQAVGQFTLNAWNAHASRRNRQPSGNPAPPSRRGGRPALSGGQHLPREPQQSGAFATMARIDPVPYTGMFLTTVGFSFYMFFYLHV
jgi:serine/threonine protein kinase